MANKKVNSLLPPKYSKPIKAPLGRLSEEEWNSLTFPTEPEALMAEMARVKALTERNRRIAIRQLVRRFLLIENSLTDQPSSSRIVRLQNLFLSVAQHFEPGLRIEFIPHRFNTKPKFWTIQRYQELVSAVDTRKLVNKTSDTVAIKSLVRDACKTSTPSEIFTPPDHASDHPIDTAKHVRTLCIRLSEARRVLSDSSNGSRRLGVRKK